MYIHKAVEEAMKRNCLIIRKQIENGYSYFPTRIKPTNSIENCIVYVFYNNGKEAGRKSNWTPSADDLMADDWEVFDSGEAITDVHS